MNLNIIRKEACNNLLLIMLKYNFIKNSNDKYIVNLIINIEYGIFLFSIKNAADNNYRHIHDQINKIYITKLRNVLWYLSNDIDNNNLELINKIKEGKINPLRVAFLKPDQINEELYLEIKNTKNKRLKSKIQKVYNKLVACPRCKLYMVETRNLYNRALDESTNLKCQCDACGYRWNIG